MIPPARAPEARGPPRALSPMLKRYVLMPRVNEILIQTF